MEEGHSPRARDDERLLRQRVGTADGQVRDAAEPRFVEDVRLLESPSTRAHPPGRAPFVPHEIIDADGDGDIEVVRHATAGHGAALYDHEGNRLWEVDSPRGGFAHLTHGDLDADGRVDFLVDTGGRVRRFDASGRLVWEQQWDRGLHSLEIVDVDGDGRTEAVYRHRKERVCRDGEGKVTRREVAPWPASASEAAARRRARIVLAGLGACQARISKLAQQAFPAGFSTTRLRLAIDSPAGETVYEEVIRSADGELAKGDGAILALPDPAGGSGQLLGPRRGSQGTAAAFPRVSRTVEPSRAPRRGHRFDLEEPPRAYMLSSP